MKYKLSLLSILFCVHISFSQNSKITTGIIQEQNGEYEEAIETLEAALSKPEVLKDKNILKGYYYLSSAYQKLTVNPDFYAKYPNAAMNSYSAYLNAKKYEKYADKSLKRSMDKHADYLALVLYNEGARAFNKSKGYKDYDKSASYFKAVTDLDANNYNAFIMLGYARLNTRDTIASINALDKAISSFKTQQANGEKLSNSLGNAYIINAQLNYYTGNVKRGLALVDEGKSMFNGVTTMEKQTYQDLDKIGLTIYSNDPALFQQAVENFEKSIAAEPENNNLKLSYVGLLSKRPEAQYQEKAIQLSHEVLKNDPDNLNANFNLGAIYVNKAADMSQKMNDTYDNEEYLKLEEKMKKSLASAYPYMSKLHQLQPNNLEWVNQLISIVSYMPEKNDEFKKLLQLRRQLQSR